MKARCKILAVGLALSTLLTAGCTNNDETKNNSATDVVITQSKAYERGIHEINYTVTSDWLVKDNATEYAILIPENASAEINYAVGELQELFLEATKVNLPVIKDDAVGEYTADKKVISLGNTTYAEAANVKATKELKLDGYIIQTVGKSIFINSNSDVGVTFGVYGFLELQFNFECFSDVYYVIDKQQDVALWNFDVRDVPDFSKKLDSSQYLDGDGLRRMRNVTRAESWAGTAASVHSVLGYISPDEHYATHPKWFKDDKIQLCYTAHGDEEERTALVELAAEAAIEQFKSEPTAFDFMFGQMDKAVWCACDACMASKETYGTNSAVQIQFVNDMAKYIEDWMKTDEGKPYARDFDILYLAYNVTLQAPAKWNEIKGEYEPIDETVIPAEHTRVVFAPLHTDFQHDIYDECNEEFLELFYQWQAVAPELGIFNYWMDYTSFWHYFNWYPNMQNLYQLMADCNIVMYYEEAQDFLDNQGGTAWSSLRNYLSTKLSWNVNLDIDALTKRFFENYFDEGADELYEAFMLTRAVAETNSDHFCNETAIFTPIDLKALWSKSYAETGLAKIEKAMSDIQYLKKVNPLKYNSIYNNIASERLSYEYILVEYYGDQYPADYVLALKQQAKKDAADNGITVFGARPLTEASAIWEKWGV